MRLRELERVHAPAWNVKAAVLFPAQATSYPSQAGMAPTALDEAKEARSCKLHAFFAQVWDCIKRLQNDCGVLGDFWSALSNPH